MKTQKLLAMFAVCAMGCTTVLAQKDTAAPKPAVQPALKPAEKPAQPAGNPSEEAMMKAWMEAGTPGEGQKPIAQLAGEWDSQVKFRMAAEAPWQESKGVMTSKLIYEGRFLHGMFAGDMDGMPFQGTMVMGYNNVTKVYESTWCDSMSTCIMFSTGSYDASKKAFSMKGEVADPMQNGKKKTSRTVTTIVSADKHVEEFFEPGMDGKEFKTMEITFTRKTGAPATDTKAPAKPGTSK